METKELFDEIKQLPVSKRLQLIELTLKSIRETEERNILDIAFK